MRRARVAVQVVVTAGIPERRCGLVRERDRGSAGPGDDVVEREYLRAEGRAEAFDGDPVALGALDGVTADVQAGSVVVVEARMDRSRAGTRLPEMTDDVVIEAEGAAGLPGQEGHACAAVAGRSGAHALQDVPGEAGDDDRGRARVFNGDQGIVAGRVAVQPAARHR